MRKVGIVLATLLSVSLTAAAQRQSQGMPAEVSVRYGLQVSNGPTGTCGCFTMQGAAADVLWRVKPVSWLGIVADVGGEHTGNMNNVGYGLTLTTFTAGPRVTFPVTKFHPFAQLLLGVAHGSGSQFPVGGTLVPSATSLVEDFGIGADYPVNKRISVRVPQLDFLHTSLPNNTDNKQNHLRVTAGITFHFSH